MMIANTSTPCGGGYRANNRWQSLLCMTNLLYMETICFFQNLLFCNDKIISSLYRNVHFITVSNIKLIKIQLFWIPALLKKSAQISPSSKLFNWYGLTYTYWVNHIDGNHKKPGQPTISIFMHILPIREQLIYYMNLTLNLVSGLPFSPCIWQYECALHPPSIMRSHNMNIYSMEKSACASCNLYMLWP